MHDLLLDIRYLSVKGRFCLLSELRKLNIINSFVTEVTIIQKRVHWIECKCNESSANQWTGFCMIGTSVMKELMILSIFNSMFCNLNLFILRSHNLAKLLFLNGRKIQLVFGFLLRQWWFSMTKYEYEHLRQFTWKIKHDKRLQVFERIQKIKILLLVKKPKFWACSSDVSFNPFSTNVPLQ